MSMKCWTGFRDFTYAKIARAFADDYALRAGDVFNRARAGHALDVLLRRTRGAVRRSRETFDVVDRNGQRILIVDLREPAGRARRRERR